MPLARADSGLATRAESVLLLKGVNIRERGLKTGLAIAGIALMISFGVGIALNQLLRIFPVIT